MKKAKAKTAEMFPATESKIEAVETKVETVETPEPIKEVPIVNIKETIKEIFSKMEERKTLLSRLNEIESFLSEYDIQPSGFAIETESKSKPITERKKRETYPELNMESFTAFLKESNGHGQVTGTIVERFGLNYWNQFRKANETKLRFDKDGVTKTWFIK